MNESKKWYQSKGFWGSLMTIASTVAIYFQVDLGSPAEWATVISALIGSGVSLYGRVKAVKKITL